MKTTLTQPSRTAHYLAPDTPVLICMASDGILYLQQQLERDIAAKALGWRPIPFTLFELLDIARLLPEEIVNVVMSHAQRRLISQYCAHYYKQARDSEDTYLARMYDEFLDALLSEATLITFSL